MPQDYKRSSSRLCQKAARQTGFVIADLSFWYGFWRPVDEFRTGIIKDRTHSHHSPLRM